MSSSMNLPPGYRFVPTDFELVNYHLLNKIINRSNLIDDIKDVQLYNNDPRTLAESHAKLGEKEWYFFTPRNRKYPQGDRPSRSAGNGYWKATGADRDVCGEGGRVIGKKKTLVFYRGTYKNGVKTDWIMHEFRVVQPPRVRTHANDMKLDDWVLCRIYEKDSKKLVQKPESSSGGGGREREQLESSNGGGGEREEEANNKHQHHQASASFGDLFLDEMMMADWDSIDLSSLLQDNFVPTLDCVSKAKGL